MNIDVETRSLLHAIRDGAIRDPNRIRIILRSAKAELDEFEDKLSVCRVDYYDAQNAFIKGWPEPPD